MADKDAKNADNKKKGGLPLKTALILTAVLLLEGVLIVSAFMLYGGPADVHADPAVADEAAKAEEPIEIQVADQRFPNTKRGRTYLYDTEVYVVVKRKNEEQITAKVELMSAQINADIREIIGRADPSHLLEPTLATLRRQIQARLDERLGLDEEGRTYIQSIVITKFTQFRADL